MNGVSNTLIACRESNGLKQCRAPANDSWVWGVPMFDVPRQNEEVSTKDGPYEGRYFEQAVLCSTSLVSYILISILFGLSLAFSIVLMGYSLWFAGLAYVLGGAIGFFVAIFIQIMRL